MSTEFQIVGNTSVTTLPDVATDLQLVAFSAEEMKTAQQQMAIWFAAKEEIALKDYRELSQCVDQGKEAGMDVRPLQRQARVALRRAEFYEKCKLASEAGYCVVPNMPAEAFAIRTNFDSYEGTARNESTYRQRPGVGREYSQQLPAGDGDYHDAIPEQRHGSFKRLNPKSGREETVYFTDSDSLQEVQFPISVAKPSIMSETTRAMALRVFDELQVLPGRTGKGDPLVLGTIHLHGDKHGLRRITFLIAWYVDTRTLP